jgi:hypothetical protein
MEKIKPYLGWIVAVAVGIALAVVVILFNVKIEKIMQETRNMVEMNIAREQFYIEWHKRVATQSQNEHTKSLYFNYASEIIRQHYLKNPSQIHRQMRPDEIYSLLDTIYCYASSGVFPTASYPDGLFLPLAFIRIETDFYPEVIGEDGERCLFQFMHETARSVYSENGRPFVDNFWESPNESVWLWFNFYRKLSMNFINEDKEREIRWSALAYNTGLYRNRLIPYFQKESTIEDYLREYPLNKGSLSYNWQVFETFIEYKKGFGVLQ